MLLRSILPQLLAVVFGWKYVRHRRDLLITFSCTVATIIFTLGYIYPINETLMVRAGGNNTPEIIRAMSDKWILCDRIRFVINLVGFFFLLRAFRRQVVLPGKN